MVEDTKDDFQLVPLLYEEQLLKRGFSFECLALNVETSPETSMTKMLMKENTNDLLN
jgi:hypothetical protein